MRFSVRESIQVLICNVSISVSISMLFIQPSTHAEPIPKGWQASNVKVLHYTGLDGCRAADAECSIQNWEQ